MKRYNPTVEQTPMGAFAAMVEKPEGDYIHIDDFIKFFEEQQEQLKKARSQSNDQDQLRTR